MRRWRRARAGIDRRIHRQHVSWCFLVRTCAMASQGKHKSQPEAAPGAASHRPKRTTMHDVARLAGVSVMTVSNVVRRQNQTVKLETRRKVEDAIARLNYRPNISA